jgi:hypothetical protein
MQLHPAVAFAAALAGGSIGGLLGAFMALPAAAVIQAAISSYLTRHEVVESELTREDAPVEDAGNAPDPDDAAGTAASLWSRFGASVRGRGRPDAPTDEG